MLTCPFCRARLNAFDVENGQCSSCGQTLPESGSVDDSIDLGGHTVQTPDEAAAAGSSGEESDADDRAGGATVQFDDAAQAAADEFGRTYVAPDESADEASPLSSMARGTVPLDAGVSPPDDAGRTIQMDDSQGDSSADTGPDAAGAFRTMAMDDAGGARDSQGTVQLPDEGGRVPPDEVGSMHTIQMSGEDPPSADSSLGTDNTGDSRHEGSRTMADMSQSALFADDDPRIGEPSGSEIVSAGSAPSSGSKPPTSASARPSDSEGSSLSGLSDSAAQTHISDDWADPGILQTIATPDAIARHAEQIVKTVWMDADKARPGMTLKGRDPKKAVKPATGMPLVIKPRVLKRREDSVPGEQVEYELLKILGEGGMGVVYDARQMSIDRNVALKMLKPATATDEKQKQKFLAEAVVTGDLDHPNIVPIYDVGTNDRGHLFYSMKKVQGTPWHKLISQKSQAENIEILMKVADAVAFAHARGVVHRDLKPENVMLGEFGETLVMDWGLAQSTAKFRKRSSITESTGMGGTPAYMAPEMATGPMDKIGLLSDVYLLGAILYEIVTGKPPHVGKNAMMCLMAAAKNEIVPTPKTGELVDIALKAMATAPADRYPSVLEFQGAIRDYLSHSESVALSTRAVDDLAQASRTDDYQDYARAMFGFQEATELWSGNSRARTGLNEAKLAYAGSALRKGDYDLGASLLDPADAAQGKLLGEIRTAVQERERRQQRLKVMRRFAGGLVAMIIVVVGSAAVLIYGEQQKTEKERQKAVSARDDAVKAQKEEAVAKEAAIKSEKEAVIARDAAIIAERDAKKARDEAIVAEREAKKARDDALMAQKAEEVAKLAAVESEKSAVAAKEAEEYEAYVARIGLASAKIKENAFETALELLKACEPKDGTKDLRDWEWGRLMHLCTLEKTRFDLRSPVDALAVSPDGKRFLAGTWDSHARVVEIETQKTLLEIKHKGLYVHAAAWSPDNRFVATGGSVSTGDYKSGQNLTLWDVQTGKPVRNFTGHTDAVLSVAFSKDGRRLLSASFDKTARLWDVATGIQMQAFKGHTWTVWSAAFAPDEQRIVTASNDATVRVWTLDGRSAPPFTGHKGPVFSAAFSPDGRRVVSGGQDKRVLLWQPSDVKPYDFEQIIDSAAEDKAVSLQNAPFVAFDGHNAPVRSVTFSKDGKLILSGAQDNTLKLWAVDSRAAIKTFRGHDELVRTGLFLPDGTGILSASHDNHVMLWSIPGKEEFRVLAGKVLEGHQDEVLAASFSKDGQAVVTAGRDRTARTWNLASGETRHILQEGHEFLASAAIFFPGGKQMLTSAIDGTVRIWNVDTGTEVRVLNETGQRAAVALSADGQWIATGGGATSGNKPVWSIQLWNAGSGEKQRDLAAHFAEITALAFARDGRTLISGDSSGNVILWDLASGKPRAQITGHNQQISAVAALPGGTRVLTASYDGTVGQWDLATGREIPRLNLKHPDSVLSMDVSADGKLAATACDDKRIRLWNVETAEVLSTLTTAGRIEAVRLAPDAQRIAGVDSQNKEVHLWDARTGVEIPGQSGPVFLRPGRVVWSAAFVPADRPDAGYLLTVGGSEARLWSSAGKELMDYAPSSTVASAGFSPDGSLIVTGSWDWSARIWNSQTGKGVRKLEGHAGNVNSAVFSPDGLYVLTASDDKTARLWETATGKLVQTFSGHTSGVLHAVFSSDGKQVVTGSNDRTAKLWNVETGKVERTFEGHIWGVRCVAITRDGQRIVTGSDDTSARVWNTATGQVENELTGHTAAVISVACSPDGRRILTGSADNNAKLWDAVKGKDGKGKEILTLDGHSREVTSVTFSPDGHTVLTGSRDGTARIWLAADWKAPAKLARAP